MSPDWNDAGKRHAEMAADAENRNRHRPPISAEAFGAMRVLWTQLDHDARLITRAVEGIPPAMAAAAVKPGVGATPAGNRIVGRLPLAPLSRGRRKGVWRFLQPQSDTGQAPAVEMMAVLLGATGRPPLTVEPFGLLATRHSLGRCYDQTGGRVDLRGEIFAAHDALLALPIPEGARLFTTLRSFILPTKRGAFLAEPRCRVGDRAPVCICRTWVHGDQLHADQDQLAAAWAELVAASAVSPDVRLGRCPTADRHRRLPRNAWTVRSRRRAVDDL